MIHVANAGTVWVCSACAQQAPGKRLGVVTDALGPMARIATLDDRQPDGVEYLLPCPWCGDDAVAVRRPVLVRLVVDTVKAARARGLGDVSQARVVTEGQLVPASDFVARAAVRSEPDEARRDP